MGTMENFMERKWENFGKELLMHLWGPWAVSIHAIVFQPRTSTAAASCVLN